MRKIPKKLKVMLFVGAILFATSIVVYSVKTYAIDPPGGILIMQSALK